MHRFLLGTDYVNLENRVGNLKHPNLEKYELQEEFSQLNQSLPQKKKTESIT